MASADPCPFCNSTNVKPRRKYVECLDCHAMGPRVEDVGHLYEAATAAWNQAPRRTEAAAPPHALRLLSRWLIQHSTGGAADPCGVATELVAETREAVGAPVPDEAAAPAIGDCVLCNGTGTMPPTTHKAPCPDTDCDWCKGAAAQLDRMERRGFTHATVAAWLLDRVAQYNQESGYHAFVAELRRGIRNGEVEAAARHGELDDLVPPEAAALPREAPRMKWCGRVSTEPCGDDPCCRGTTARQAQRLFSVRLTCCGMDQGQTAPMPWDEADRVREHYLSGSGVLSPDAPEHATGHRRSAIIVGAAPPTGEPPR